MFHCTGLLTFATWSHKLNHLLIPITFRVYKNFKIFKKQWIKYNWNRYAYFGLLILVIIPYNNQLYHTCMYYMHERVLKTDEEILYYTFVCVKKLLMTFKTWTACLKFNKILDICIHTIPYYISYCSSCS